MSNENKKISEIKDKLNLMFEKIGALTRLQRLLICIATFILIGSLYYYAVFMPKNTELKIVNKNYQTQENKLKKYKKGAAALVTYEKMMAEKQEAFGKAMGALPDKRELPSLLTGISQAGSRAGLSFHLFQPEKEVDKQFYKEIPVSIKVVGQYHQLTDFFFQIIRLNRIVNINNVAVKSDKKSNGLEMACKAVTYMFVEKKEIDEKNSKQKRKNRAKK